MFLTVWPDRLIDRLADPEWHRDDLDRQLVEISPLLGIGELAAELRLRGQRDVAEQLLLSLPEDWRIQQRIEIPADTPPRLVSASAPIRIDPAWSVRLEIGSVTVDLGPFERPDWASALTFDRNRWQAQAPDGRWLTWVPRRPVPMRSSADLLMLPWGAWWDANDGFPVVRDQGSFGRPNWAVRNGVDEYGYWAEFEIPGRSGPVTQRLRWIPPGEFWMGSPESEAERRDDETLHRVVLSQGFWLADTACTQALWEAVLGENPSHFKGDPANPVEQVSWNDIHEKFLPALNRLVPGLEAVLPSEAQWEYACRAGTQTPFWFGEQITPEQVNYDGNYPYANGKKGEYREKTVPVKSLPANGWGLYEMHGNVYEWCEDVLGEYPKEAVVDPIGPQDGVEGRLRVLRGGSWLLNGRYCRSAYRNAVLPGVRNLDFGFRLARGLGVPQPAGQGAGGAGGQRAEPVAPKRSAKGQAGTDAKTRKGAA
ncbi:MAG TPA: formylglycine-generating enzyme family protein [Burkholderiaceae bacterium]|nr:formylglycine-generating enzyme family protein [Burkholderiaceae bacterium]